MSDLGRLLEAKLAFGVWRLLLLGKVRTGWTLEMLLYIELNKRVTMVISTIVVFNIC